MYFLYRTLTSLASPFVPAFLQRRLALGKEDAARLPERLGHASLPRPAGKLVWIHAASVGETNAVLPLIAALLHEHPQLHVLLTTVTVTSAALLAKHLPTLGEGRAIHQFAPVDTPAATSRFLSHWRPDVALWVDSEFWPNLMHETQARGIRMGIVNARMSLRSYNRWRRLSGFVGGLLSGFSWCFAQSDEDAKRLKSLGLHAPMHVGNLKYDAPPLPCDEAELARLRAKLAGRPVWVAASTHPGEEQNIAQVHAALGQDGIRPLTIIVPRHAARGDEIAHMLLPFAVARRSAGELITPETDMYLADTMGELGLFYRLASVAFIGGTLVPHGGQNPLEAARLGCAIIAGPHMENFAAVTGAMEGDSALLRVRDGAELTQQLRRLLPEGAARAQLAANAQAHVNSHEGVVSAITQQLQPLLSGTKL